MIRYRKFKLQENRNSRRALRSRRLNESQIRYDKDSVPGGENWEIADLDVWGGPPDPDDPDYDPRWEDDWSWDVNNVFKSGEYICMSSDTSDDELARFINSEILSKPRESIDIVDGGGEVLFIEDGETGEPLFYLYRCD